MTMCAKSAHSRNSLNFPFHGRKLRGATSCRYSPTAMTAHRYVPRSYATEPERFGRPGKPLTWREVGVGPHDVPLTEQDWLRAAQIQEQFARRVRDQIGGPVTDFAETHEISYGRLSRMLRGENVMKLEDVAELERLLGLRSAWQLTLRAEMVRDQ